MRRDGGKGNMKRAGKRTSGVLAGRRRARQLVTLAVLALMGLALTIATAEAATRSPKSAIHGVIDRTPLGPSLDPVLTILDPVLRATDELAEFVPPLQGSAPSTCDGQAATVVGTEGDDEIQGTPGNDVISSGDGNDIVHGAGGDDVICAGGASAILTGDGGDDLLINTSGGAGYLYGGTGDDVMRGGSGSDHIEGGSGDDVGYGENGFDFLGSSEDEGGDDLFVGGPGEDGLVGGGGDDHLDGDNLGGSSASDTDHCDGGTGQNIEDDCAHIG